MSGLSIAQLPPGARLRGHVRRLACFEERSAPIVRREVPFTGAVIIFSLGPDMLVDGRWTGSFTGGLYARPIVTGHSGEQAGLQLDVTPLGMRAILGVPGGEIGDRIVALEDVLPGAAELTERIAEAPTWGARRAILDAALGERAAQAPPVPPAIAHAYRRLLDSHGAVRVEELAAETGWSRRHLAERFRREIGLPPKTFARLARFEHAVDRLRRGEALADAAYACGYADQPHMNRDFRQFFGGPPTELPNVQDAPLAA